VERATAPQDALQRTLLGRRGLELLLVRLAARPLCTHGYVFSSRSTNSGEQRDIWLQPRQARLTAWAQAQRLAAVAFCQPEMSLCSPCQRQAGDHRLSPRRPYLQSQSWSRTTAPLRMLCSAASITRSVARASAACTGGGPPESTASRSSA